jgi:hypothetical protein
MKLALQIAVPVFLYLFFGFFFAEDASDVRYFLLMPICLALVVVAFGGFILFLSWLY